MSCCCAHHATLTKALPWVYCPPRSPQFAFTEIMGSMRTPAHFPRAVFVCTVIMSLLYGGLGAIGYWSRGDQVRCSCSCLFCLLHSWTCP